MFYEPYRPRRRTSCLGRLFRVALILAILWVALMLVTRLPLSINLPNFEDGFSLDGLLSSGYTHVLLLGADNEEGRGRTDTMIVASLGGGDIKLTSIMRDTLVDIDGYGKHKINAAYRLGGEQLRDAHDQSGVRPEHHEVRGDRFRGVFRPDRQHWRRAGERVQGGDEGGQQGAGRHVEAFGRWQAHRLSHDLWRGHAAHRPAGAGLLAHPEDRLRLRAPPAGSAPCWRR